MTNSNNIAMIRPPIHRAMRALDRSLFTLDVPLAAAQVRDNRSLSQIRSTLNKSRDILDATRVSSIQASETDPSGPKCVLLSPQVRSEDQSTWSPVLKSLQDSGEITIRPYTLNLDYSHWTYEEIMRSIVTEEEQDDLPTGYNVVGHVAHLNLRERYLPYKHLIAQILIDKNSGVKTVINKLDDVGAASEFRTFNFEVLAGKPDLNVEVREADCSFCFDYSKVYYNTKLSTEHERLVNKFKKGEAVCDVMAGVGPFAVPAGKKMVFVWANDLNPACYGSLQDAIHRNKVQKYVKAFNEDGRSFILKAVLTIRELASAENSHPSDMASEDLSKTKPRQRNEPNKRRRQPTTLPEPEPPYPYFFSHFVMNLPATATTFLPQFIGMYDALYSPGMCGDREGGQGNSDDLPLPMIHVYCFQRSQEDDEAQMVRDTFAEINHQLGLNGTDGRAQLDASTPETEIWNVRDVSPHKRMFCASFRLPREVAFRR